jgi:FlaA1/EpsC-like NDP-sugar epimerase
MLISLFEKATSKNYPRGFILAIDLLISFFSFVFSFSLLNNFLSIGIEQIYHPLLIVLIFRLQAFLYTQSYVGIIKYTSTRDAVRIGSAVILGTLAIGFVSYLYQYFSGFPLMIPAVIVMDACLCLVLLISMRVGLKILYKEVSKGRNTGQINIIIYGADETGVLLKRKLEDDPNQVVKVTAFIDPTPGMAGKTLEGEYIYPSIDSLDAIMKKGKIHQLIIVDAKLEGKIKKEIIEKALKYQIELKAIPPAESWINGKLTSKQIRAVSIDDLLGRETIELENENIKLALNNKTILITGGAGSIGSEIVRQCLRFNPKMLIVLDQAESPLHDLVVSFKTTRKIIPVIADIRNYERIQKVFEKFKPDIVFHAAAYKHVPLMEDHPYEAIQTNVFGTKIIADLSVQNQVQKFIYISSDKAVNPTNIMGASKRISEIYVQSLNAKLELEDIHQTKFITTRFGNVLGSNGSVVLRFQYQIETGGPITVTHPEITRYFMTIPEACKLVLEAGAMGNGGEIYIFDMGESIKIADLAEKMIKLSGLEPHKDINIIFTGLRPGEKLKEELLNNKETTIGTHHPKIMIAKVPIYNFLEINETINSMSDAKSIDKSRLLVSLMKQLVPEYISNNSIYETLDKKISSKE